MPWKALDCCGNSDSCIRTVQVTSSSTTSLASFNLPAAVQWYDTGSNLLAGANVTITALGTANVGPPGNVQDPNGSPIGSVNLDTNLFLAPGARWWSLIGKIGPAGTPV